jgi:hypothetical protein
VAAKNTMKIEKRLLFIFISPTYHNKPIHFGKSVKLAP